MSEQHDVNRDVPSPWQAFGLLIVLVTIQIMVGMTLRDLGWAFEPGDPTVSTVALVVSYGALIAGLLHYKRLTLGAVLHPSTQSVEAMLLVLAGPILLCAAGSVLWLSDVTAMLARWYPISEAELAVYRRLLGGGLATLVAVAVVAPLAEEILFRGIILRAFMNRYSETAAITSSALLFSAFHLSLYQLPSALCVGLFLGWLYVRTRSVWPAILAHSIYNTLAWTMFEKTRWWTSPEAAAEPNPMPITVAGIVLTAAGLGLLARMLAPRPGAS